MIEVVLRAVRVDIGSATPLLLLEERDGPRVLSIYIGAPEAAAISYALQGIETERPMTHDLVVSVLEALGGQLTGVVVVDLVDGTYFAELMVQRDAAALRVSSRPSDAIAVALRRGVPIFVADDVMSAHGRIMVLDDVDADNDDFDDVDEVTVDEVDDAVLLDEMRAFLDDVNPEDFLP